MAKILIISYWFPPLHAVAALRIYAFAKYLQKNGYDVTVLTIEKAKISEQEASNDISAIHVEETVFKFASSISNVNTLRQAETSKISITGKFTKNLVKYCEKAKNQIFSNAFTPEDLWFVTALGKAYKLFAINNYDVVLSSSAPITSHFIAYLLKIKHRNVVWFADYRDMWSYNGLYARPVWPIYYFQRKVEKILNNRADCLVTVSEPLKEILSKYYRGNILVLENGYFPEDTELNCDTNIFTEKKLKIVHTGTVYEKYNIVPLLIALNELFNTSVISRDTTEVLFCGDNVHLLRESIEHYSLADVVTLRSKIPRKQSLCTQRNSTMLLFLGHESPLTQGVLTGKIFEYIVSGKPIIALGVTEESSVGRLITATNTGYVCGENVSLIVDAVKKTLQGEVPVPDQSVIGQYRRDRLVGKLCQVLQQEYGIR
jgi:glycosyltransferase involved in cell wall biosynthesis